MLEDNPMSLVYEDLKKYGALLVPGVRRTASFKYPVSALL